MADLNQEIPWQIKAIVLLGTPTVIALYLVWILAQDVRGNQNNLRENFLLHSSQTTVVAEQNIKLGIALENLRKSIDALCANTARTTVDRKECFR